MIPSRLLDLGGIIAESINIVKKTYWRSALTMFVCMLPGLFVTMWGVYDLADSSEQYIHKLTSVSPDAIAAIRDRITLRNPQSSSLLLYRIEFPEIMTALDSVHTAVYVRYPDELSRSSLRAHLDSIMNNVSDNLSKAKIGSPLDFFAIGLIITGIGLVLWIFGSIMAQVAIYDLGARAFEERSFNLGAVFWLALGRNMWLVIVQLFLIVLAMMVGLGAVIGIAAGISSVLAVLGALVSMVLIGYSIFRIMFARVALVSEGLGPIEAIKRSIALTSGSFWRIVGITLIAELLVIVVSAVINVPFSFLFQFDQNSVILFLRGNPPDAIALLESLKSFIILYGWKVLIPAALVAAFMPSFITTFYYELRTRLDGPLDYYGDDTAGLTPPPQPPFTSINEPANEPAISE